MLNALKIKAQSFPERPGVYLFEDSQKPIYVGKALSLKNRVFSYFQKDITERTKLMLKEAKNLKVIETGSEFAALLLESRLIKLHLPKYNIALKDDKSYLYIFISLGEEFPKIFLSRRPKNFEGAYYGPFPSSQAARSVLKRLRRIFPYCQQKRLGTRACFYSHIGLCGPCPSYIAKQTGGEYKRLKKEYRSHIFAIKKILEGQSQELIAQLTFEMTEKSQLQEYESARLLRNQIAQLEYITINRGSTHAFLENPNFYFENQKQATDELKILLTPYFPKISNLAKIECFDISNLGGQFAVGAQVVFMSGVPEKSLYRRYKIKLPPSPNDVEMLREMIARRLTHHDWEYPNLIIVDGGAPQVGTVANLFRSHGVNIPLIGLAKRLERIIILDKGIYKELKLRRNNQALGLLQQIRDETHRFAITFHRKQRAKAFLRACLESLF